MLPSLPLHSRLASSASASAVVAYNALLCSFRQSPPTESLAQPAKTPTAKVVWSHSPYSPAHITSHNPAHRNTLSTYVHAAHPSYSHCSARRRAVGRSRSDQGSRRSENHSRASSVHHRLGSRHYYPPREARGWSYRVGRRGTRESRRPARFEDRLARSWDLSRVRSR